MTNMVEQETVWLQKPVAKLLTEEMEFLGLSGKVSRAEFLGTVISDALLSFRAAREAAAKASKSLMVPYSPEEAAKIAEGGA